VIFDASQPNEVVGTLRAEAVNWITAITDIQNELEFEEGWMNQREGNGGFGVG
jgi:hypothetical protein